MDVGVEDAEEQQNKTEFGPLKYYREKSRTPKYQQSTI